MSLATWTPGESSAITLEDVTTLLALESDDLDVCFTDQEKWQRAMKQKDWRFVNELTNEQLWQLTVLFTRLEAEVSGFEAGENNPAIAFFKLLKRRKATPDQDSIRWLKSLTNNRYIPHGPILL